MRILIVDDEKDVRRLFEQRFRREQRNGQIDLHFAHSGLEALSILENGGGENYALILSDINMPEMNGLELLKRIRISYPNLNVFMVTAYSDSQNQEMALGLGATDYFTKPLDFKLLKERIL